MMRLQRQEDLHSVRQDAKQIQQLRECAWLTRAGVVKQDHLQVLWQMGRRVDERYIDKACMMLSI